MVMNALIHNARIKEVGVIGLGIKVEGEKFPRMVHYFVVDHLPEVVRVYGKQPIALHVRFPSPDPAEVADNSFKAWSGQKRDAKGNIIDGTLKCTGNGSYRDEDGVEIPGEADWMDRKSTPPPDEVKSERDERSGIIKRLCYGVSCVDYKAGNCKRNMQVYFRLPLVSRSAIYRIDTSAAVSIRSVYGQLHQMVEGGDDIRESVFELYRKDTVVKRFDPEKREMVKKMMPLMHMRELDPQTFLEQNAERLQLVQARRMPIQVLQIPSRQERLASPSRDLIPTEQPALEIVSRTPGPDSPEALVDHPDLQLLFEEFGKVVLELQKPLTAKDKLIIIKKKEGAADLKEEVRRTLVMRIQEKKEHLAAQLKPPPENEVTADLADIT